MADLLDHHPGQRRRGGCHEGIDEGQHGIGVRLKVRACVEPEPAHPQQRGADHRQRQAVGRHRLFRKADPLADDDAADQARDPGVDVHDRAAGKVQRTPAPEKALVVGIFGNRQKVRTGPEPDHMRDRIVAQQQETDHEHDQRPELHPLGEGTDDQGGGDAGKRHLEDDKGQFRDVDVVREGRSIAADTDARQERLVQPADEGIARREGQAVADRHPHDRRNTDDREHLHKQAKHVLGAHHAAVEQRQRGDRHHQHQRRGQQHPRRVALVHHGRHLFDRRVLDQVLRQGRRADQQ